MKRALIALIFILSLSMAGCDNGPYAVFPSPTVATPTTIKTSTKPITSSVPVVRQIIPVATTLASGESVSLQILSLTSPVFCGKYATLKAKTQPGAVCSIAVYYSSGKSEASGLISKTADNTGNVSWTWMVGTNTKAGSWKVTVMATIPDPVADALANQAANNVIARGGDPGYANSIPHKLKLTSTLYLTVK